VPTETRHRQPDRRLPAHGENGIRVAGTDLHVGSYAERHVRCTRTAVIGGPRARRRKTIPAEQLAPVVDGEVVRRHHPRVLAGEVGWFPASVVEAVTDSDRVKVDLVAARGAYSFIVTNLDITTVEKGPGRSSPDFGIAPTSRTASVKPSTAPRCVTCPPEIQGCTPPPCGRPACGQPLGLAPRTRRFDRGDDHGDDHGYGRGRAHWVGSAASSSASLGRVPRHARGVTPSSTRAHLARRGARATASTTRRGPLPERRKRAPSVRTTLSPADRSFR